MPVKQDSLQPYLAGNAAATHDAVFVCLADDFNCDDPVVKSILWEDVRGRGFYRQDYTRHASYFFNGMAPDEPETRMGGKPFSSVREPSVFCLARRVPLVAADMKRRGESRMAKSRTNFNHVFR